MFLIIILIFTAKYDDFVLDQLFTFLTGAAKMKYYLIKIKFSYHFNDLLVLLGHKI